MELMSALAVNANYLVISTLVFCVFLQYLKYSGIRSKGFLKLKLYFCLSGFFWLLICLFFASGIVGPGFLELAWYWQVLWALCFLGSFVYILMSGQLAAAVLENAEAKMKS